MRRSPIARPPVSVSAAKVSEEAEDEDGGSSSRDRMEQMRCRDGVESEECLKKINVRK